MRWTAVVVLASLLAAPALADDLFPPPWRGAPGSTFQHWTFSYDQGSVWFPEASYNPYGQPAIATYYGDEEWYDVFQGRQGVVNPWWNEVYIGLPNVPEPNDWKIVYVQITYWPIDDAGLPVAPQGWMTDPPAAQQGQTNFLQLADGWNYESWEFWIPGNPPFETVIFNTDATDLYIDQIVVDTICIPEPASLLLLCAAGLLLRRR